ncbi:hypothetical protein QBC45DRAFT_183861 [Copromyces sp. CBS 386.78]|nr:hypothetical protein QBC45DRAFT_183861 [Copromyces sp. CBS 386.78]
MSREHLIHLLFFLFAACFPVPTPLAVSKGRWRGGLIKYHVCCMSAFRSCISFYLREKGVHSPLSHLHETTAGSHSINHIKSTRDTGIIRVSTAVPGKPGFRLKQAQARPHYSFFALSFFHAFASHSLTCFANTYPAYISGGDSVGVTSAIISIKLQPLLLGTHPTTIQVP